MSLPAGTIQKLNEFSRTTNNFTANEKNSQYARQEEELLVRTMGKFLRCLSDLSEE